VLLLVIATVFGSNHVAARLAFEHGANVTTAVAFRSTGTALFVLALLAWSGISLRVERATLARAIVIGLFLALQSYCLYSAVARIPVALALLAFQTFPMLLSLISWAAGGERPSRRVRLAMPVALIGLLEHANIRLPLWLDDLLSLVFSWPNVHKVHHSRAARFTDTNYGNLVCCWDRLFSTFTPAREGVNVAYGLTGFDDPATQSTAGLLALPFRRARSAGGSSPAAPPFPVEHSA